jgi:hypothetical protein
VRGFCDSHYASIERGLYTGKPVSRRFRNRSNKRCENDQTRKRQKKVIISKSDWIAIGRKSGWLDKKAQNQTQTVQQQQQAQPQQQTQQQTQPQQAQSENGINNR